MSNPWDRPPLPTQGDDSEDITYAAAGRVLSQWENIEGELSHMFALFIGKMWTNEAYDTYYATGKTTQRRLTTVQEAASSFFISAPNQAVEGLFCGLQKQAEGFSNRRHEVAHGIVRPIDWYWPILGNTVRSTESGFKFCLVPPHYQRNWIKDGAPEYIYTSRELLDIAKKLYVFLQELMDFRFRYLPDPRRPKP